MRRLWVELLMVSVALAQEGPTFRGGVALVHVDAEVLTSDGRILSGFTKDDFVVLDNGKPQTIVQFAASEEPLDLILLFDISGSMHKNVQKVAEAAGLGFQELRPGDRVAVMVFTTRSRVLLPFTEDLTAVERCIQERVLGGRFRGGTHIQSAVDNAAKLFFKEPRTQRRRAVLIVTDNIGVRTRNEQAVVRDFWEADAILSGLIVGSPSTGRKVARHVLSPLSLVLDPVTMAGMKGIAEKTGGDAIESRDPGPAFQEAMHRIRTRYSLYYAMPEGKPGSRRTIKVSLIGDKSVRIRARGGYVVK